MRAGTFCPPTFVAIMNPENYSKKHKQNGNSLIEFALVAVIFFTLLLAIAEFSIMFWVKLSMQHAVREGARYSITGRTDLAPPDDPSRYNAVIARMRDQSIGLYDIIQPTVTVQRIDASGVRQTINGESFGNPGDIVVIRLDCEWPMTTPFVRPFFQNGIYRFSVRATMRNEAFTQ